LKILFKLLFFISFVFTNPLVATQEQTDDIAEVSAVSLYNIDPNSLEKILKSYIKNHKNIKALKVTETLTKKSYFQMYRENGESVFNKSLPQKFDNYRIYKSKIEYENEIVGEVIAYYEQNRNAILNKKEIEWIEKNPEIKVIKFFDEPPFTLNSGSKKEGYIYELIEYLIESVGLKIEYIDGFNSYKEMLDALERGKVDILTTFPTSLELGSDSNIVKSKSILKTPFVLIGDSSFEKIDSIESLFNKKVAVVKGYVQDKYLDNFPQIEKVYVSNNAEGFEAIRSGRAKYYINNRANSEYILNKTFSTDLRVVYNLPYDKFPALSLSFAMNGEKDTLTSILKKGLKKIPYKKIQAIRDSWIIDREDLIKVNLTEREQEWIQKNPVIKAHNETNWAPFNFYEFNQPKGYSIELLNMVAKNTGLNIEYVSGPTWNEFLKMMKKDELDIMINIVKNEERSKYMLFTDSYINASVGIATTRDNNSIQNFNDVLDKKVAIERGFYYHDYLNRNYPDTKLYLVDDGQQTLQAVSYGEADVTIGFIPVMKYIAKKNFINNLRYFTDLSEKLFDPIPLRFSVRKDTPELLSILQKGLATITPEQQKKLQKLWLSDSKIALNLTQKEKQWLSKHKKIKFTADPNYLPYEAFDKSGEYFGMVADYLKIIEKRLNIEFIKIPVNSWSEALEKAKKREVDILSNYSVDKSLEDIHTSTKPYIKSPIAIVTQNRVKSVDSLTDLKGKKVAVIRNYGYLDVIFKKYPSLNYIEVENAKEGLEGVSAGEFDAIICSLTLATYAINDLGLHNLHIAGQTDVSMELGLGIRKDWKILIGIINKVISSISQGKKQEINKKWIGDSQKKLKKIELTPKEQAWVDKKEPIDYVYDVSWAPFEWKNEFDKHNGLTFDILSLIQKRSGIELNQISTNSWVDAVDLMKSGKADMYSAVGENRDRKKISKLY